MAQSEIHFTLDLSAPRIAITGVSDGGSYGKPVTPTVAVEDPDLDSSSVTITLNDQPYTSGTAIDQSGTYTLAVAASDTTGHQSNQTMHFTVSTQPPTVTISGVSGGSYYNHAVTPGVTAAGMDLRGGGATVTLDGAPFTPGTAVSQEGPHTIEASVTDGLGRSAHASVSFTLDMTPPVITVDSPDDNSTTRDTPATLSVSVSDANPDSLDVNGQSAGSGGSTYNVSVPLTDGSNSISIQAADKAGNTSDLTWHVTLTTTRPSVTITTPSNGMVTRSASVDVSGSCSQDVTAVTVNGMSAATSGGAFTARGVPLAEGSTIITATGLAGSGQPATTSVTVVRDSQAPIIAITSPSDGSHTSAGSVTVTGTIADGEGFTATLNGAALSVNGTSFSAPVNLAPGTNWITVVATDAAGNESRQTATVVRDSGDLKVLTVAPSNGTQGASTTAPITVTFSRTVLESSVTSDGFQVSAGGQPVAGAFVYRGDEVTFLPSTSYGSDARVTVSLNGAITDLSGNTLSPFSSGFATLGAPASAGAPELSFDSYPGEANQTALTVTGTTSPGASIAFTGGAGDTTATAGGDGRFSADLTLTKDSLNTFSATASLDGQSGTPVSLAVMQDSTPPFVTGFAIDASSSELLCDFSEAIAPASATIRSVVLTEDGSPVEVDTSVENGGTRLRITPEDPITGKAALTITTDIADLAGNHLASPYVKTFNGGSTGRAFLEGQVFDDSTGLPLAGADVALVHPSGGETTTGGLGAWALGSPSESVVVHEAAPGFTDAYRQATVGTGEIQVVLDARLTPLSQDQKTLGGDAATTAVFAGGKYTLSADGGTLPDGTHASLTVLSSQGLPFQLPIGFSPSNSFRLDLSASPIAPMSLSLPAPDVSSGSVPAAYFDPQQMAWVGVDPATVTNSTAVLKVAQAGTYVLLRPDAAPLTSPPDVVPGEVVTGVGEVPLDASSAQLGTEPSAITPSQKAVGTLVLTPSGQAPSGLPFQVTFTESLDVRTDSGTSTHSFSPYTEDLFAYQDPANTSQMKTSFPVSPFPGIDVVTLIEGRIDLAADAYSDKAIGGGIYDPSDPNNPDGLDVAGSGGTQVHIPSDASSSPLPVRVMPVAESSLLAPVPANFQFLGGVQLNLGGGTLTKPATLSLDPDALAASFDPSDTVIVAKATTVAGVATYTVCDLGVLNSATGRLETALAGAPWPMVMGEGRYAFFRTTVPMGIVSGKVLTQGDQAVSGAAVGLVPTSLAAPAVHGTAAMKRGGALPSAELKSKIAALVKSGRAPKAALAMVEFTGLTSLSASDGWYVLPAPVETVNLKAVDILTADTGTASATLAGSPPSAGQNITIAPTPFTVVSTSPVADATNVPVGSTIYVSFSKLVDPSSLGGSAVQVTATGASGQAQVVSVAMNVVSDGKTVAFLPGAPLPEDATVSVTLSGVTDRMHNGLTSPVSFAFTTVSRPPAGVDPGLIQAFLPDENGMITVSGGIGAVQGGAVVYLANAVHPEYGTVTVSAGSDGSFSVSIKGAVGERVELHVLVPGRPDRVYVFSQLVSQDGATVSMGSDGGTFTAKDADGAPLATIQVPAGAFDGPATIGIAPLADLSQAAPVPDGFTAGDPIQVTMSTYAKKEISIILHPKTALDPDRQYWLVKTVTWGPNHTKSPMVVDTMRTTACPGDTTGGTCLITQSPPFPGLRESEVLQLYQAPKEWGFVTGTIAMQEDIQLALAMIPGSPFVCLLDFNVSGNTWTMPVDPSAQSYQVNFDEPDTGKVLVTTPTRQGPPEPGTIASMGIITDVTTRPYILKSAPFASHAFQLKAQAVQDSQNPAIGFYAEFSSPPVIHVYAPQGTTAPRNYAITDPFGDDSQLVTVEIHRSGDPEAIATAYAPIEAFGDIHVRLDRLFDGSGHAYDLMQQLRSGDTIKVTYPMPGGSFAAAAVAVPYQDVSDGLRLAMQSGHLHLKFDDPDGNGGAIAVYDAMADHANFRIGPVVPTQDVDLTARLGDATLAVDDVLCATVGKNEVDPLEPIMVNFDRNLQSRPLVLTEENKNKADLTKPYIALAVVTDPDTDPDTNLPNGMLVPIDVSFDPSDSADEDTDRDPPREPQRRGDLRTPACEPRQRCGQEPAALRPDRRSVHRPRLFRRGYHALRDRLRRGAARRRSVHGRG